MVSVMRGQYYKYALTILVALLSSPMLAQYSVYDAPPPKWDLYGNAGFDFAHNSLDSHVTNSSGNTSERQLGGTVDATLNGFVSTPEFLSFGANVNDFQNTNSTTGSTGFGSLPVYDSRNGAFAWSAYAAFLSGRGMPLYVHYIKTDAGVSSSLFHNTQGSSEFGVNWRGKLPHLPWMVIDFRDSSNDVSIPTSLQDTSNKQKNFIVNAHDRFLGWNWNGNFAHLSEDVSTLGATVLPATQTISGTAEDL